MDECPFCAIVAGERDAHVLHRDESAVAFLDANSTATGHAVVAPTWHAEGLLALDDAAAVQLAEDVRTWL